MPTALAVLAAANARTVLDHARVVVAAEFAITGAARDVLDARLARGDDILAGIAGDLRGLTGVAAPPPALPPPGAFRPSPPVLAHPARALGAVAAAARPSTTRV